MRPDLQDAVEAAIQSYSAVNTLTYGRLSYLLLVAMAGEMMAVYAMPLAEPLTRDSLVPLVSPFEVTPGIVSPSEYTAYDSCGSAAVGKAAY